jgi:hypothetical protein
MKSFYYSSVFILLSAICVFSQPAIMWERTLGGNRDDLVNSIQQTTDGGFIIAGCSDSEDGNLTFNNGLTDYWVVKLDFLGNIEWERSLGGSGYDRAFSLSETYEGGFIVVGHTNSDDGDVIGNHGNSDFWVVKLDSYGEIEWSKCFGGSQTDIANSVQQTTDGGYIIAGETSSDDGDVAGYNDYLDFWIVKLDSYGDIDWSRCIGGISIDIATSVRRTWDGSFIVAGYTSTINPVSGHNNCADYRIVKLDYRGEIIWDRWYGGRYDDEAYSVTETPDRGFIVAGRSESNDGDVIDNHGGSDFWILKLDSLGNIDWSNVSVVVEMIVRHP